MLLNLILIALVFGASKKRYNPYFAALIVGALKGAVYFVASKSVVVTVLASLLYGGLAAALVHLLSRVDMKEANEEPYPKYGTWRESPFKWEYVPLAAIVVFIVFDDLLAAMLHSQGP